MLSGIKSRLLRTDRAPPASTGNLRFEVHRISGRKRPEDPRRNLIIPCFSEFGCEVVGTMFIIPRLAQMFPGHYTTAIGWFGREYLYRHLVDEFWELGEEHQGMREAARAFHHTSEPLRRFEEGLREQGLVTTPNYMGRIALGTQCNACGRFWEETKRVEVCGFCQSRDVRRSLFSDPVGYRPTAVLPRPPSPEKLSLAGSLVGKRPAAVFARNRQAYGRNLPAAFYEGLIDLLLERGYTPLWMGERQSTLPCPRPDLVDFSRMTEARDLELTMAIISLCEVTVQFWTASTRLAAMAGVPYLLFESPDQLWGRGQEGYRLDLVTRGRKKIAANHFLNVLGDQPSALRMVSRCLSEMEAGDYGDVIGMVDDPSVVQRQRMGFARKREGG